MSSSRKSKRRTNPIAKALRTPTFRQRKIRPKKGRGSYSRANGNSRAGECHRD
ncbi:MAG: alternative ribosome rescue factor ArfA [Alphaproteobacteria bacterium]